MGSRNNTNVILVFMFLFSVILFASLPPTVFILILHTVEDTHKVKVATLSAIGLSFDVPLTRPSDTKAKPKRMAVIWGLDLAEMRWWKFKGSYMFNQVYHLRRAKMIVYQVAMIFCIVSESVGTAALSGLSLAVREILKHMLIAIFLQTTTTSKMESRPAATGKPSFTTTTSWASPPLIS
jgi:hypothetical protein